MLALLDPAWKFEKILTWYWLDSVGNCYGSQYFKNGRLKEKWKEEINFYIAVMSQLNPVT